MESTGSLDVKIIRDMTKKMKMNWEKYYSNCHLCPRKCGVNRLAGEKGFCLETSRLRVAAFIPHFGEEPPITGTKGSGTIFFSGCTGKCPFCQNYQLSLEHLGRTYTAASFKNQLKKLIQSGVHNLNLVTAEHFLPTICKVIEELRQEGHQLPVILNSSGFLSSEALELALEYIDIFLPDFKFLDRHLAHRIFRFPEYPEVVISAIDRIISTKGLLEYRLTDAQLPLAYRGLLVRHMIIPGFIKNSIHILELLRNRYGKYLPLSILAQYTPLPGLPEPFNRVLTQKEYETIVDKLEQLDFKTVYLQRFPADQGYFPDFRHPDPFPANHGQRSTTDSKSKPPEALHHSH